MNKKELIKVYMSFDFDKQEAEELAKLHFEIRHRNKIKKGD